MVRNLKNQRGQTSIEWLLLLLAAFMTAYVMIQGPVASFTRDMLTNIMSGVQNLITHAEWTEEQMEPARGNHPTSGDRLKPMHL